MLDQFFDFARRRHQIYLDRQAGKPFPWSPDPIFQQYRFTNVFRELDATTIWFRENVRERYDGDDVATLLSTVVFRLFNRITTGEAIFCQEMFNVENGQTETPFETFLRTGVAEDMREGIMTMCGSGPYCTGSYIINSPNGMDKLTGVLWMIQQVRDEMDDVLDVIYESNRALGVLRETWDRLRQFPHIADFTSYEIVTDLRHTKLMGHAKDHMTWANPGPGAMRGLNRIHGRPLNKKLKKDDFVAEMRDLLAKSRSEQYWPQHSYNDTYVKFQGVDLDIPVSDWPTMEMRDIEHTLCEFDKYMRTKLGEGRPRGKFNHR